MLLKLWNDAPQRVAQGSSHFIPDKRSVAICSEPIFVVPASVEFQSHEPSSTAPVNDELQHNPLVSVVAEPGFGPSASESSLPGVETESQLVTQSPIVVSEPSLSVAETESPYQPTIQNPIIDSQHVTQGPILASRSVQESLVYKRKSKLLRDQIQPIESFVALPVHHHGYPFFWRREFIYEKGVCSSRCFE
ncbi:hypothetical protein V6N12_069392 [Hibiscus sabdariffa]|uniref:Uncharacterized protein n=1 Tax=Hibiscus sabdariffa TaxID=183260 RepID=A0ABR2FDP9_9ROSI